MTLKGLTLDANSRAGGAGAPPATTAGDNDAATADPAANAAPAQAVDLHGVVCTFGLRSGSYATSLLRELFDLTDYKEAF